MTVAELYVLFGLQPDKGSWSEGMGLLKSLRNAAQRLIGIEAVKSLVGFVEHAAEAGTHIIALSKQFGISTQSVQEWAYVAKQSGSNINQFGAAISQVERNLRRFAHGAGSKEAAAAFTQFGISQADAAKALDSPEGLNAVLFKIADRSKAMGNTLRNSSGIFQIAGRYAQGFAADMAQGSDAIRTQIAHLHELGGVLSDEQLGNLKKLHNNIVDMKTAFSSLALQVVGTLAPALAELAESAAKWIAENRDLISGALETAITAVAYAFEAVGAVISTVGDIIRAAMGGDDGATAILIGLAVAIGTFVIPALASMAVAVIAATWPFLAIAAVAALIAYGILLLVRHWDAVKQAAQDFLDWIIGGFEMWGDFLYDAFVQPWIDAWNKVKELAHEAWEYVKSLDWAKAIPILGPLGEILGHGAAKLLGGKEGGRDGDSSDLDAIDNVVQGTALSDMAAPANASPHGGNAQGVVVQGGTTNLTINVKDVDQARQAKDKFDEEQAKHNRAAASVFGGGE